GLHFHDIKQLLDVLFRLRDQGNTIVVIEHNLDVIKTADWIVDLGPEGGSGGGEIIATGTPETVASEESSYTGHFLKRWLYYKQAIKNPFDGGFYCLSHHDLFFVVLLYIFRSINKLNIGHWAVITRTTAH